MHLCSTSTVQCGTHTRVFRHTGAIPTRVDSLLLALWHFTPLGIKNNNSSNNMSILSTRDGGSVNDQHNLIITKAHPQVTSSLWQPSGIRLQLHVCPVTKACSPQFYIYIYTNYQTWQRIHTRVQKPHDQPVNSKPVWEPILTLSVQKRPFSVAKTVKIIDPLADGEGTRCPPHPISTFGPSCLRLQPQALPRPARLRPGNDLLRNISMLAGLNYTW